MPRLKNLSFLFFILLLSSSVKAQRRTLEAFDVLHYKFEVDLNDTTDLVAVRTNVTLTYRNDPDRITFLDLKKVDDAGFGMKVDEILVIERPVTWTHEDFQLNIATPSFIQKGDTVSYQINYSGVPSFGLVISQNAFGDRTFFAEHWPNYAHHWLPVIDHPMEKATCEFIVTAPDHYSVIANGKRLGLSQLPKGMMQTHWLMDQPISTKVMVIGVADFITRVLDSDSISTAWVYKSTGEQGLDDFSDAPEIKKILTKLLGEYPFGKSDHIESTTRFGGMENAGNIFYSERLVGEQREFNDVIAHEIAHQWFGNSVTETDWEDVWLSEGFATFLTYYFIEEYYGMESLLNEIAADEWKIDQYQQSFPRATVMQTEINQLNEILNPLTYQKAGMMLRMLMHKVGKETFNKILVSYYEKYKYGNATTENFIEVAEEVSLMDLDQFFHQWLYVSGSAQVEYSWNYSKGKLELLFDQKTPEIYHLDFDIQIVPEKMKSSVMSHVSITERTQTIVVEVDEPKKIIIDPHNVILGGFYKSDQNK